MAFDDTTTNYTAEKEYARMSEEKTDYRITPLGEDNYITWKWQISMILKQKNLVKCITGECVDQRLNDQASTLLASSLSQLNMQKVINCTTAKEIWDALEANFENKSSSQRSMLMEKFTSFKIKSVKDISKGIGEVQSIAAKLKSMGATIDDEFIISIILKALPENFRSWKSTWKMVNAENPSLNGLITGILAEIHDMKTPESSALVATSKPWTGKRQYENRRTKKNECFYCKKPGHWAKDCRKKQADEDGSKEKIHGVAMMATDSNSKSEQHVWIADSGATFHMTPKLNWLQNYTSFEDDKLISLGDDRCIKAKGIGHIDTSFGRLLNVHYVPKLKANLFSISAAAIKGIESRCDENGIRLIKNRKVVLTGERVDGIYNLMFEIFNTNGILYVAKPLEEWHKRLGHVSNDTIKRMAELKIVDDLNIDNPEQDTGKCLPCGLNKCTSVPHPERSSPKVSKPGLSIHFDTVGPFKQESLGLSKFLLVAKDEASSYKFAIPLISKTDIPRHVKAVIAKAEIDTGNKPVMIVSDCGTEFLNRDLKLFCIEKGIIHQTSVPYTPQQNGFIEREIRTIIESARTLLNHAKLPASLWAEAVNTAVYVLNRTINSRNNEITPFELWFGKKPSVKNLHIFGQKAIVKYRDHSRSKWDEKGVEHIFVGYTDRVNVFRFYDPETGDVFTSCDAIFIDNQNSDKNDYNDDKFVISTKFIDSENDTEQLSIQNSQPMEIADLSWDNNQNLVNLSESITVEKPGEDVVEQNLTFDAGTSPNINEFAPQVQSNRGKESFWIDIEKDCLEGDPPARDLESGDEIEIHRQKRKIVRSDKLKSLDDKYRYSDINPRHIIDKRFRDVPQKKYHAKLATLEQIEDPKNYVEAMQRHDKNLWINAMQEEIDSLKKNKVYVLVDRPKGNIVTNKWVLKIKRKPNGEVERYKARLVARGFTQSYGVDYLETYAPVANMVSVRMIFAHAAMNNLLMAQFDIKTAFLNGDLEETVYMEQPEGFLVDKNKVCLLKRSLYGLKQSPRQWNKKFTDFLKEMNLEVSNHDNCVFFKRKPLVIIAIYVDDGIIFSESKTEIDKILNQLKDRFEVHMIESQAFLGFQIERNKDGSIYLHQKNYIQNILKRFNMEDCKSVDNPISITKITANEEPLEEEVPYREAIGCLMYAAVITRIDIAYAVNKASRSVEKPTQQDWVSVKRIFRYLKAKEHYGLIYKNNGCNKLKVFCDADFAGDNKTSRSTTGSIYLYGKNPIHWKSQRQALITLSSTEAEFVSLCSTVKETIWLRKLSRELNFINAEPTEILCDNQSAIRIGTNEKCVHRTRHMSVQANYPREQIELGEIELSHVKSGEQLADMLTKPTTSSKFIVNTKLLMQTLISTFMILLNVIICRAFVFEPANAQVWKPLEGTSVELGSTIIDLDLVNKNPCEFTPPEVDASYITADFKDHYNIYQQMKRDCNQMYDIYWKTRLQELVMITPQPEQQILSGEEPKDFDVTKPSNNTNLSRKKRVVPVFLIVFGGISLVAVCITNLVSTLFSYILPWGDGNRIGKLESQQDLDRKRLDEFENRINMTHEVNSNLQKDITGLTARVLANEQKIKHLTDTLPRVVWIGAYLQNQIQEAGARLESVIRHYKRGQADMHNLAALFNNSKFYDIDPEDTFLESVTKLSNATYKFKLILRNKSQDTKAFKMLSLNYHDNITTTPSFMRYEGWKYLIFNSTSNCIKAIEYTNERMIQDRCETKDWKDPKLTHWVSYPAKDHNNNWPRPQVNSEGLYNYVYCYKYNITMMNITYPCPSYPFKLHISLGFNTTDHNYPAKKLTIRGNYAWSALDTILPSLLQPIIHNSDIHMLNTIESLKSNQRDLIIEDELKNTVTRYETILKGILMILVIGSLAMVALYMRSRQRHTKTVSDQTQRPRRYIVIKREKQESDDDSDTPKETQITNL